MENFIFCAVNDITSYPREIRKNTPVMPGNVQDTLVINFRTCEIDKPVIINSTSSSPRYIASSLLAPKANKYKRCTKNAHINKR